MWRGIRASLMLLLFMMGFGGAAAQSTDNQPKASGMEVDVTKIKQAMLGSWESIAPEIRPSKNPDGSLKPFYLKRAFKYLPSDRFELEVVNSADPNGAHLQNRKGACLQRNSNVRTEVEEAAPQARDIRGSGSPSCTICEPSDLRFPEPSSAQTLRPEEIDPW